MEGCTGGRGGGNGIGGKDPLCSAVGIGAGNGSYIIHNIGVVIARHDAVADIRDAVGAGKTAAQLLANCNSRAALAIFSGRASIV